MTRSQICRFLAVLACIVAVILLIVGASASAGPSPKDLYYGLVAIAAAIGFLALEGV